MWTSILSRTFLWSVAAVAAVGVGRLIFAPARPPTSDDGRILLQYWEKWTGFEGEVMAAVVADFNASQSRIRVRKLTVSQIDQKLLLATSGGNPPDLAGLWSHNVSSYAEKGALAPLDHMLADADISASDYLPVFWELCRHRGLSWAMPITPATVALHWNKKLFREAGLDPNRPPVSLAELDAMAERLTIVELSRGGQRVRCRYSELSDAEKSSRAFDIVQLGFSPFEPGWWNELWCVWFGGELWDGDKTITADAPANVRAYEWVADYPSKYGLDNLRRFGASFGNFSSPQNPFLSGQVAMVQQGVWMHNFIEKYAPGLEWGAAAFPADDPAVRPNVTIAETDVLVIPRGAPHPREAFEFIRYVSTPAVLEKLNLGQRKFSPRRQVSEDFFARHPNPSIRVFADLAASPNARHVPGMSMWAEYRDEMLAAADRIFSLAQTPQEALGEVRQRVQWKFERTQRRWERVGQQRLEEWNR